MTVHDLLKTNPQARIYRASKNIAWFARYYLEHHVSTALAPLHHEWINIYSKEQRAVVVTPRAHGKSSWWSLIFILHAILHRKKKLIILISDTQGQANDLLGAIMQELETNQRIIRDYGKLAGYVPPKAEEKQKWTTEEIVTTTGIKIIARGWKSKQRGIKFGAQRPDLIVIDDIENDEAVNSELQREKLKKVFTRSILNLGDHTTQVFMVGTILHFDSLLMNFVEDPPPNWRVVFYKAIKDDGKPLWPEMWPLAKLEERKAEIGSIAFEQEFMNNPLDPSVQILKPKAFYDQLPDGNYRYYGFVDLAISEKTTADYFALVTIARNVDTGKLYVVEPFHFRGDVRQQLETVFSFNARYHYEVLGIEAVAYQKAFYQLLTEESQRRGEYIATQAITVDMDKVRRAIKITPHIENGTVVFNLAHQDFMSEVQHFPKGAHDDFCFIGSTKVVTDKGTKSIKDVQVGDMVLSRGFNRVSKVYDNGIKETVEVKLENGVTITGTGNHPVYVPLLDEYLRMDTLVGSIVLWKPLQTRSQLTELHFADIRTQAEGVIGFITNFITSGRKPRFTYIDICMKNIMVLFLMVAMYIIKTATHLITRLITWSVKRLHNIYMTTIMANVATYNASTLKQLGHLPKYGTAVKQGESGTGNTQSTTYTKKSALYVIKHINQPLQHRSIARTLASPFIQGIRLLKRCASPANQYLWQTVIEYNFVPQRVTEIIKQKPQRVYNLEVEDSHTYLANGVMVHNCDALVGAIRLAMQAGDFYVSN